MYCYDFQVNQVLLSTYDLTARFNATFPSSVLISVCIPDACLPTDIFGDLGLDTMCSTDEKFYDRGDIAFM